MDIDEYTPPLEAYELLLICDPVHGELYWKHIPPEVFDRWDHDKDHDEAPAEDHDHDDTADPEEWDYTDSSEVGCEGYKDYLTNFAGRPLSSCSGDEEDPYEWVRPFLNLAPVHKHWLIWLMTTGQSLPGRLVHKNGDPSDNRVANLAPCTEEDEEMMTTYLEAGEWLDGIVEAYYSERKH